MLCAQQRLNEAPMTADPDRPPMFRLLDPQGVEIAKGSMSAVSELILDSKSRKAAEALLCDAAAAVGRLESINARADAVIEREREVVAREQALLDAAVRRFCDGVLGLEHRLDRFERQQIEAELAALPDPDSPGRLRCSDHGDLEPLGPSHPADREVREATLASERETNDAGMGDLPSELDLGAPPPSGNFVQPGPEAPTDARKRLRFREPRQRKGKDFPPQPIAVSLTSCDD
jgi:hypothetical protein